MQLPQLAQLPKSTIGQGDNNFQNTLVKIMQMDAEKARLKKYEMENEKLAEELTPEAKRFRQLTAEANLQNAVATAEGKKLGNKAESAEIIKKRLGDYYARLDGTNDENVLRELWRTTPEELRHMVPDPTYYEQEDLSKLGGRNIDASNVAMNMPGASRSKTITKDKVKEMKDIIGNRMASADRIANGLEITYKEAWRPDGTSVMIGVPGNAEKAGQILNTGIKGLSFTKPKETGLTASQKTDNTRKNKQEYTKVGTDLFSPNKESELNPQLFDETSVLAERFNELSDATGGKYKAVWNPEGQVDESFWGDTVSGRWEKVPREQTTKDTTSQQKTQLPNLTFPDGVGQTDKDIVSKLYKKSGKTNTSFTNKDTGDKISIDNGVVTYTKSDGTVKVPKAEVKDKKKIKSSTKGIFEDDLLNAKDNLVGAFKKRFVDGGKEILKNISPAIEKLSTLSEGPKAVAIRKINQEIERVKEEFSKKEGIKVNSNTSEADVLKALDDLKKIINKKEVTPYQKERLSKLKSDTKNAIINSM